MPDYSWVCHSCKESNKEGDQKCCACGFPAVATGAEIDEAVTGIKLAPRQSRKEWQAARRLEISTLPFWKKPLAYALQGVRLIGAVIMLSGIFSLSLQSTAFGFAIVAVAELLYQLFKGKPRAGQTD